jgi:hypothetical protein
MAKRILMTAALTASLLLCGTAVLAQTPAPTAADVTAAQALATTIDANIAALGPNATQAQITAVINNTIVQAAVSPTVALAATQAVRVANPNSPAVQAAAISVATAVLVSTGTPVAVAQAQAAAAPPAVIVQAALAVPSVAVAAANPAIGTTSNNGTQVAQNTTTTNNNTNTNTGTSSGPASSTGASTGAPAASGGGGGGGGTDYSPRT